MNVTPEQQSRLTLKQKFGLYWPPRTNEGAVLIPPVEEEDAEGTDKPLTLEEELQRLDVLAMVLDIPAEKKEELRTQLKAKYEASPNGSGTAGGNE